MTIHPRYILIYLSLSIVSLSFLLTGNDLGFILTKPIIVPVLLVFLFFKFKSTKHSLIPLLMVATFFSFLGDVFLMFKIEESLFKLLGLCTFIVAQSAYAFLYYFSTANFEKKEISIFKRWPEILTIIITALTTTIIYPSLGAFAVPAVIYAIISSITIVLCLNRRFYVSKKSFVITISGVMSFFISDALMGDDIFLTSLLNHFFILVSYFIGHLLIINGMMIQINTDLEKSKSINV